MEETEMLKQNKTFKMLYKNGEQETKELAC